jgi:hypothetical protein
MKLEDQVKQLTDLMADLIPTVDRLAQGQQLNTKAINQLVENTRIIKLEMSEMRLSNMRLAEAIEKLVVKIDKIDQFEERLSKLEKTVYK